MKGHKSGFWNRNRLKRKEGGSRLTFSATMMEVLWRSQTSELVKSGGRDDERGRQWAVVQINHTHNK